MPHPSAVSLREFPVENWDRYEFIALLGQGGMGAVYKARDKRLSRIVALKFIRGADPNMVMRFIQEARAQARIHHPNVCKVFEVGEIQGQTYIAMQYIDGKPLDQAGATMTLTEKVVLMQKVAEAMHEAHKLGIIHRDLKPANIMVERGEDGSPIPVVMDFGLAREAGEGKGLTETGAVMGTPAYMPPEQARGETRTMDRRSDVYSLGATLYDLLVGIPPFDSASVVDVLFKVVSEDPRPLRERIAAIPPDLETIVMKCLNKEPNQRYDSAKVLAEDLERYIQGEAILGRRLSLMARMQKRARKQRALFAVSALTLLAMLGWGIAEVRQYLANERERKRIEAQAMLEQQLAQHLGEEITKMEWVLRSARQLPIHDLEREKNIIRNQMAQLQQELASYGGLGRGPAHYALGRGHMALHEYAPALTELRKAMELGTQDANVHYALGVVLGKHFEQAMYEARLAGGGDWAKQQLKDLEPKYLVPAIDSLKRSRAMKSDAPRYLEALIAYYQRDYGTAIDHAEAALRAAPWLYEASNLLGDIHLEQALQARDSGKSDVAEKELVAAEKAYQAAAEIGHSDGDVYEGLAEAWVRRIEMALRLGQPTEPAYAAAVAASEKLLITEPRSIDGPLKKAFAAMMTMKSFGAGLSSTGRLRECLLAAEEALERQPGNPYASDVAASCNAFAAESARSRGEDPEPLLRKALALLEPTIAQFPHFLGGLSDLGNVDRYLGIHMQLHGNPAAKEVLQKSLEHFTAAAELAPTYQAGPRNVLGSLVVLVQEARSEAELRALLLQADQWLVKCTRINNQDQQAFNNYFQIHARAASRALVAGIDPGAWLARALENLAQTQKLGGGLLDAEQHAALTHVVQAEDSVRRNLDPASALLALQADLRRCFSLSAENAMCRTLDAKGSWVAAEWAERQHRPPTAELQDALRKASLAIRSPEVHPDAWQVLAETHLRLARAAAGSSRLRDQNLVGGLAATEKLFSMNPQHALGRATQGALLLLRAQTNPVAAERAQSARASIAAFQNALQNDPLLNHDFAPLLARAQSLVALR